MQWIERFDYGGCQIQVLEDCYPWKSVGMTVAQINDELEESDGKRRHIYVHLYDEK
jgi:hypothetical protein